MDDFKPLQSESGREHMAVAMFFLTIAGAAFFVLVVAFGAGLLTGWLAWS